MGFQLVQAAYWLALSLWFGSAAFVAIAANSIFETLKQEKPTLGHVLAVNLEDQHGVLLGSSIMSRLLGTIGLVQLVTAGVVIALTGVQFAIADVRGSNQGAAIIRIVLALAAGALVAYDRFSLAPRLAKLRATYIENADTPETANPAKDAFDRDQQFALTILMAMVGILAGLILFSSAIVPASTPVPIQFPAGVQK